MTGPNAQEEVRAGWSARFPNLISLGALAPALALVVFAQSGYRNPWEDLSIGRLIWAASGLALGACAVVGVFDNAFFKASRGWSLFALGWASAVGLAGAGTLVTWDSLPHDVATAMLYTVLTCALWQMGIVLVIWSRLAGVTGSLARAMSLAVGVPFTLFAFAWATLSGFGVSA